MGAEVVAQALPARALPARSGPMLTANATLVGREDLSAAMSLLRVRPDDGVPPFQAGQYFALGLWIEGRLVQRPYSAASASVSAGELEFLVRLIPGGALTPRLWQLRPEDRLRIGPPKGLFGLMPDDERTHLFLSTGTGLAPFIAMVDQLQRRRRSPRIVLIHGAAHVVELAYRGRLESLAGRARITYVPAISRPGEPHNAGWQGAVGRLETVLPGVWEQLGLHAAATVAYLCGNPGMITGGSQVLTDHGLARGDIHSEEYWTVEARSGP
jgi:ferredoxin--NADP+ reductase